MDRLRLRTIGRRTGEPREAELYFLPVGSAVAIAASNEGADEPPAWYRNLQARPEAEVERDDVVTAVQAREATPEERAAIYPRFIEGKAAYAEYERMTSRPIAVVILELLDASDGRL
jgi:deazaflavin-dependent oxidoreductase (nitroreductase family)